MNNLDITTLADIFLSDVKTLSKDKKSSIEKSQQMKELKINLENETESFKWASVLDQVSDKMIDLFEIPVKDIMMGAWNKYQYLDKYFDKSKSAPDETILVPMVEHTIKSQHHPSMEILLNDHVIDNIKLDIVATFKLKGIMLVIKGGKVSEIQTGTCKVSGTVKYDQMILVKKELGSITLPGKLSLEDEDVQE